MTKLQPVFKRGDYVIVSAKSSTLRKYNLPDWFTGQLGMVRSTAHLGLLVWMFEDESPWRFYPDMLRRATKKDIILHRLSDD